MYVIGGRGEAYNTVLMIGVSQGVISTGFVTTTTGALAEAVIDVAAATGLAGGGEEGNLVWVAGQMVVYWMIVFVWMISEVRE